MQNVIHSLLAPAGRVLAALIKTQTEVDRHRQRRENQKRQEQGLSRRAALGIAVISVNERVVGFRSSIIGLAALP